MQLAKLAMVVVASVAAVAACSDTSSTATGVSTTTTSTIVAGVGSSTSSSSSSSSSSSGSSSGSATSGACALVTPTEASQVLGQTVVTEERHVGDYDYCYFEPAKNQASIASVAIVDLKGASAGDAYSSVADAQFASSAAAGLGERAACSADQTPNDLVVESNGQVVNVAAATCDLAKALAAKAIVRL